MEALALVAVVAACASHGGTMPHPSGTAAGVGPTQVPTSSSDAATTPHAVGFNPESFSAISDTDWWVLSSNACHRQECPAVARTTNGGRTFSRIAVPRRALSQRGTPDEIRFADANDGYLFGKQLYLTHDGGKSWHAVPVGRHVEVAVADGYAYAVVGRYRRNHLLRSKAAGDDWNRLPTPSGFHLSELWAQGSDVFLYGQSDRPQGGRLLESTDAGATWQTKPLPIEDLSCSPDVVQLPVIWVQCASGMTAGLWRSTDGGQTYVNPGKEGASAEPNAAVFAVAANDTVVVGFQDLRRTTDGGVHWHAVGPKLGRSTEWDYLGFTDARHGVGIRLSNAGPPPTRFGLWQTSDGGAHWTRVRIS